MQTMVLSAIDRLLSGEVPAFTPAEQQWDYLYCTDAARALLLAADDPGHPEDLGAEMEFFAEGQPLRFDGNTAIFLPAGVKHTPVVWKSVRRPHIEMSITLRNGNYGYVGKGEIAVCIGT